MSEKKDVSRESEKSKGNRDKELSRTKKKADRHDIKKGGRENGVIQVKEYKATVIRRLSSECAMYIIVTIVNTWY